MATKKNIPLSVETLKHEDATRKNIPTAEYQELHPAFSRLVLGGGDPVEFNAVSHFAAP